MRNCDFVWLVTGHSQKHTSVKVSQTYTLFWAHVHFSVLSYRNLFKMLMKPNVSKLNHNCPHVLIFILDDVC